MTSMIASTEESQKLENSIQIEKGATPKLPSQWVPLNPESMDVQTSPGDPLNPDRKITHNKSSHDLKHSMDKKIAADETTQSFDSFSASDLSRLPTLQEEIAGIPQMLCASTHEHRTENHSGRCSYAQET